MLEREKKTERLRDEEREMTRKITQCSLGCHFINTMDESMAR